MSRRGILLQAALLLSSLLFSVVSHSHSRSYSYSLWELDESPYQLTVRINQFDLTRLGLHPDYTPDYFQQVEALIANDLGAVTVDAPCGFSKQRLSLSTDGWVIMRATFDCGQAEQITISSRLMLNAISSHMHFVTVRSPDGQVSERVLTEADNRWQVSLTEAGGGSSTEASSVSTLASYWLLGVEHILTGWDHLAFVLGLMLLAVNIRQLVWLITGFTIAHSVTLVLAALGHVQPLASAVESLIGLSIMLVAMEIVWKRTGKAGLLPGLACAGLLLVALLQPEGIPVAALLGIAVFIACYFSLLKGAESPERWRLLIAFAFGLFHGFGFAGILAEMSLPDARLLPALFGFNLGVESGQLLVIAVLWPLLMWLGRKLPVEQLCTTAIAGLGTFWFITRAFA